MNLNPQLSGTLHGLTLLALTSACVSPAASPERPAPETPSGRTRVVMLGTGTPNAEPDRSGPALAIVVDDTAYLVDCGPGVVRQANEAAMRGVEALQIHNLNHVFISHLHSDHTLGLPDLIFTPWVLERQAPLQVFGPVGTLAMTSHLQDAWSEDKHIRIDGLEPANLFGYKTEVSEIEAGLIYEDSLVKVFAFAVPHGSWKHAFGFRFETPDRVIVISGDTAPSEELVRMAEGCDVLVHEVYSDVAYQALPEIWKSYHAKFHTSTREVAKIATRVKPRLLVLTHQLYWGQSDAGLVGEIEELYDGPIVSAKDFDIL